jgi:BON domain-containing protein
VTALDMNNYPGRGIGTDDLRIAPGVSILTALMLLPAWGCVDRIVQGQDEALESVVRPLLYDYEPANLLGVDIDVTEGVIYLSGEVDTFAHKVIADQLARQTGVGSGVVNKVHVEP